MSWNEELRRLLGRLRREPPPPELPGGISCQDAAERLYEWLDGELEPEMESAVGMHLKNCALCYPFLMFESSFREAVARSAGDEKAPEKLREDILSALGDEGLERS